MGITSILSLLSGVALFMFGMSLMGDGLKKAAGEKPHRNIPGRTVPSDVRNVYLVRAVQDAKIVRAA